MIDYDEGYYAQAAKHMVEHGDWVTPYANGIRFLEKPPLLYWVTAASFAVFGINEFALRLPTALAVIALVWIVMRMARRASGERAALIAGLSTACSVGTYLFTRETLHDIWLVLFIALAMHAFLKWYLDPLHPLRKALDRIVEPFLAPIRRILPSTGPVDFSPVVLMLGLIVLNQIMQNLLGRF